MPDETVKIAVLESDNGLSDAICRSLASAGYLFQRHASGRKWLELSHSSHVDMLIVGSDVSEPGIVEVVRQARSRLQQDLPILVVASNGDIDQVIEAMSAGASDCLYRPVRAGELKARVSVLLYRAYPERMPSEQIQNGPFLFDMRTVSITRGGVPVRLAKKEFELAELFFRHIGKPLSRAYIAEKIWGKWEDSQTRTVDTHVSRVRNKLRLFPEYGFQLAQVYGFGYRLEQVESSDSS